MRVILAALIVGTWAVASAANADDWTANKLRGEVLQLVDNQWKPLARGMVIPDSRVIRTLASGRITLTRGNETVDLEPNTQIQIFDKAGKMPFTTVKEYFGTVGVEADVRQVQHFAVDTPYLAAVVKGTRFAVHSRKGGGWVDVRRGHVAVEDKHGGSHVTLSIGQTATIDMVKTGGEIAVSGTGPLPEVLGADGNPVDTLSPQEVKAPAKAAKAVAKSTKDAAKSDKDAAKDADKAAKSGKSSGSGNSGSGASGSGSSNSGSGNSGSSGSGSGHADGGKGKKGKDK